MRRNESKGEHSGHGQGSPDVERAVKILRSKKASKRKKRKAFGDYITIKQNTGEEELMTVVEFAHGAVKVHVRRHRKLQKDPQIVDRLVQDLLSALFKKFSDIRSIWGWLFQAAYNVVSWAAADPESITFISPRHIDEHTQEPSITHELSIIHEPSEDHENAHEIETGDPKAEAEASETYVAAMKAVGTLSPALRTVFLMKTFDYMTAREIAEELNTSPEAVRTRLSRARAILKERLGAILHDTHSPLFVRDGTGQRHSRPPTRRHKAGSVHPSEKHTRK